MADDVKLIFTSTTGRSGTQFLSNLINKNATNASSEHDAYPSCYGAPAIWYDEGEDAKLRKLARAKVRRLERGIKLGPLLYKLPLWGRMASYATDNSKSSLSFAIKHVFQASVPLVPMREVYLESSQGFLQSYADAMFELVPDMGIIHSTRHPFEVAKSFYNRGSIPRPGNEFLICPEMKRNQLKLDIRLTDYQRCLWYWFENELRHASFVERHGVKKAYDVDIYDLNDPDKVSALLAFFGIRFESLDLKLKRNKNPVETTLDEATMKESREFMAALPDWVLDRFPDRYKLKELA